MTKEVQNFLYPELSYQIRGLLFRVQNELGDGYQEKHIQRAFAVALSSEKLAYQEQLMTVFEFNGKPIGRYFLDFVVDNKIVVELKVCERPTKQHFDQIKQYLVKTGLPLGLLACFTKNHVKIYRVVRPSQKSVVSVAHP